MISWKRGITVILSEHRESTFKAPNRGLTLFLLLVFLTGIMVVFLPVWKGLIYTWSSSDEYSHGFFIVPLSLYMVWRKRSALRELPVEPSAWGLIVSIGSLLLYVLGEAAEIRTLSSLSMIAFLSGVVIYFYGFSVFKGISFPLFLLVFMIPVPSQLYSQLTVPLQLVVSRVSAWMASHVGVTLYREGNLIHLPDRTLHVLYACSGLRSLVSLLTLSAIFGYFTLRGNGLRAVLLLAAVPAAILVNIVRVVLMILAFYYFRYDLTGGKIHTVFGLFIFTFAVALIATTRGVLARWDVSTPRE